MISTDKLELYPMDFPLGLEVDYEEHIYDDDIGFTIHAVWMYLRDKHGEYVKVDGQYLFDRDKIKEKLFELHQKRQKEMRVRL